MSTRINFLPYREALRVAARRQFNLSAIVFGGAALAIVVAAHGVMSSYILDQESRNNIIVAENKKLDEQNEEINRLRGDIETLKARKGVIESLQSDRAAAVIILDQMVRLTPDGVYLKGIQQKGLLVTLTGYAQSNELVAKFMTNIGASSLLHKSALIEIKAAQIDNRRLSEFSVAFELVRVNPDKSDAKSAAGPVLKPASPAKSGVNK